MPVGATLAAAGIGGAASLGSAAIQSGAAGKAASAAQQAQQNTLDWIKSVYNGASGSLQPTISQGAAAGTALGGLLGLNGDTGARTAFDNYLHSTNYDFLLNQGENAVKTANAPALVSGATGKALNDYAQGMAGNALQGYEGLLAGQQGLGVNAALGLGQIGTGAGQVVNSANQASAGSQAQALGYGATAQSNALANLSKAFGQSITGSSFAQPSSGGTLLPNAPADVQNALEGLF